jgi:cell division septation protein DedD
VMAAPGALDDPRTTWGRTLGWNVMPGADTWSAKEYKGFIYAGDMARGFDIYRFTECAGVECVDATAPVEATPTTGPTPTATATQTTGPTPTATATTNPTPTPTSPTTQCVTTTWSDDLEPTADANWRSGTDANQLSVLSPGWAHAVDTGARSATHSWSNDAKTLGVKDTFLVAPTQKIGRTTTLSFWHRYYTEEGYDGGVLEVSVDGGLTWRDVTVGGSFVSGGYTGTIDTGFGSAIAGRPAWTGGSPTARLDPMTRVEVTLGGFVPAGKQSVNAQLRWRYAGDQAAAGATPGDEWWIDDVTFANVVVSCPTATPTPTGGPTPTTGPTPTLGPTPTPTSGPTATPTSAPSPTPTSGTGCTPDSVYFLGVVYDSELREDFQADVRNFEYYLSTLRQTYCIPADQATILANGPNWTDPVTGKSYPAGSEANVKAEIRRLGALANQHDDSTFFFFLSSHGIMYTNAGWTGGPSECPIDRTTGSLAGLLGGGGETGELFDALNANFKPSTRMFVFNDCSFCGGFSDSITAASGTVSDGSYPRPSGILGPNRIVMTGCAITTECFGSTPASNGGVSYYHLRNVMEAGVAECDGWTVPGFPTAYGLDVPVKDPAFNEPDGRCTASEWFFGAVWDAYEELDEIGIQQQFRIKYGFDSLDDDILIMP